MARLLVNQTIIDVPERIANQIMQIQVNGIMEVAGASLIPAITHPEYDDNINNWYKWRLTYEGGEDFIEEYTKKFSKRETPNDFARRKAVTPCPAFAKGAINEIKNSIFQRATDITRTGGPASYEAACRGQLGGVDRTGATMNWFIGSFILPELLTMKKVGVYVDNEEIGKTRADQGNKHPYIYHYRAENIRSWSYKTTSSREFDSLLLREYVQEKDPKTKLPRRIVSQFRHLYIDDDGFVKIQIYDINGKEKGALIPLTINRIPFVVFEITESLLKDVANHQIALLNMESSDVSSIIKAGFPLYTEQFDPNNNSPAIKQAQQDYKTQYGNKTAEVFANGTCPPDLQSQEEINVGASEGRKYPIGAERPGFIAPPGEPVRVSMEKQSNIKEDIRVLVQLALSNIQSKMASAESKAIDQQGLESGLSYIGLELEHGERQIGSYWTMYDGSLEEPTVGYPKRYSLLSEDEVGKSVERLQKLRDDSPSTLYRKEINKKIARITISNDVTSDSMAKIEKEIETATFSSGDPKTITSDIQNGLVGAELASKARGYPEGEAKKAQDEKSKRAVTILQSQTGTNQGGSTNPAARGAADLAVDPAAAAAAEKAGKQGRGAAKS